MDKAGSKHRGRGIGRTGPNGPNGAGGSLNGESHFEFVIPSDYPPSRDVQDAILKDIHRRGYNSHAIFAIKLALEEAMMNAIKHGNRLDPKKKVHIEATVSTSQTEIVIEDEGPGFTRRGIPDPTLPENLEKCSGRGIHLIEAYMNQVEWTRGGRRLRMIKRNEPDVHPRP
jgi:serine/threonine-protein kinase RsbW